MTFKFPDEIPVEAKICCWILLRMGKGIHLEEFFKNVELMPELCTFKSSAHRKFYKFCWAHKQGIWSKGCFGYLDILLFGNCLKITCLSLFFPKLLFPVWSWRCSLQHNTLYGPPETINFRECALVHSATYSLILLSPMLRSYLASVSRNVHLKSMKDALLCT